MTHCCHAICASKEPQSTRLRQRPATLPAGRGPSSGFTLLELLIATFIASLVIGIMTASLSFALRVWERNHNVESGDQEIIRLLEVMTLQLGSFNPTSVTMGADKENLPVFVGNQHALSFSTNYSVKSISKGVPVICRYLFIPGTKRFYYAELPFDPYHGEPIERFLKRNPEARDSWPRFYAMDMEILEFSITYRGGSGEDFAETWEEASGLPQAIMVKVTLQRGSKTVHITRIINPYFMQFNVPESLWPEKKKASSS
jgi:prepilin-type N-terminal cleavage/methylation domain-containing protein